MNRHFIFAIAIGAAACATSSQQVTGSSVSTSVSAETGTQFELKRGQQANINGTPLRIRFDAVRQDSRCPQGVQCVWAGNAEVTLRIMSAEKSITLNTGVDPKSAPIDSYTITLVEVKPAARQGGIPPDDYSVILEVKSR
jgi:hypothetical protein